MRESDRSRLPSSTGPLTLLDLEYTQSILGGGGLEFIKKINMFVGKMGEINQLPQAKAWWKYSLP